MAKSDIEQTESSGETLASVRRELEGKIKALDDKLDPKIDKSVPIWVLVLIVPLLLAAIGGAYAILNSDIKALSDTVHKLETALAVAVQKMNDSQPRR